ncbi:fumarate hydratase [Candidatus Methanoliparum sp. LAM-1]|uniref:fumarate hydratase n=1 Tax=Candidatus Methanoliparum sp. LAM-1 TaxID=2874846 RepID=UPI001E375DD2|nr:fumarate hydratase [Candidatus Methanoliparum sp. LAM-1]BDC35815.1 fumarate hydratase [Candidatus Methanoliparum sp. LAM-1]
MDFNDTIKNLTYNLLKFALCTNFPKDVKDALEKAIEKEDNDITKSQLEAILEDIKLAYETQMPICQDTGVHIFFVKIGSKMKIDLALIDDAIKEGVLEATKKIPLRPNVVHPLTRKNPGTNVGIGMPHIYYEILPQKDYLEITVLPKGAGSENMSVLNMLDPSQGKNGVKKFILEWTAEKAKNVCPPGIVGVGIGGTADVAMKIAKEALLRPIGSRNAEPEIAKLEDEMLDAINSLGIGAMGLGGNTTMLDVHIECASTHTASLPVAINFQCWAARQATGRIYQDGRIEF